MNAKVDQSGGISGGDMAKLGLGLLLFAAGVVGYYYFEDLSPLLRMTILLAGIAAGLAVAAFSGPGYSARRFLSESQFELRKVVWPTRDETVRTTAVIIAVVIILSLLLGLIDLILKWALLDHLLKMGH
ncbi:MAG: preprotein translocase subunit SecE [Rhodanobacteraceae bacterium]